MPNTLKMILNGTITLYGGTFQNTYSLFTRVHVRHSKHHISVHSSRTDSVWSIPLSVAHNEGISFDFFSLAY